MEDRLLTEKLLKQQELIAELDTHYQSVTVKLEAEVAELENFIAELKRPRELRETKQWPDSSLESGKYEISSYKRRLDLDDAGFGFDHLSDVFV
jgi:hypothetical protein